MRQIVLGLLLILLTATVAAAQAATVAGKPEELKGITKIFVRSDHEAPRLHIVRLIKEQLPQVTIVETSFEAEVILAFQEAQRPYRNRAEHALLSNPPAISLRGGVTIPTTIPSGEFEIVGSGEVLKPSSPTVSRVLFRFRDTVSSALEDKLSHEYADLFIKLYKKANR